MGDQPVARLLSTHRKTQTSMLKVGLEHINPVFEQAKMVHALNHASTVIGMALLLPCVKFVFIMFATDNDIHCKIE
jgi:hypothetical protein